EVDGVVRAGLALLRPQAVQAAAAVVREQHAIGHLGAVPGLEMLLEEARHFHDMRIGVMNDAPARIGHCSSGSFVVCESLACPSIFPTPCTASSKRAIPADKWPPPSPCPTAMRSMPSRTAWRAPPDPLPAGRWARARPPPSPIRRHCWPARW